ncbi:DUF6318 family protein [Yaniella halotolerans]|uniref:DUF6318 family protein n=1 Tax=Yaniella halotolerans TaxID=225453 RepID=UPI0003B72675|nr:DUF6318 family protein [Yaniella halotolerans]
MPRLLKQSVPSRLVAVLAALSLAAVLTGCSNDEDAELEETVDASEAGTAEYIPASADGPAQNVPEPKLPAVATEKTEEGAEATLKYFWEAIDYARLTGETDPIALVSHDVCEFCDLYMEGWRERYENGDWAVVEDSVVIDVSDVSTHTDDEGQEWTALTFEITQPAAELYSDSEKDVEESVEENSAEWIADLSYNGTAQRWLVEWTGPDSESSGT